jgi:tetratricopeptide (TPR) repeat protein
MSERDIFIAALQQEDPAQRQDFLDEACAGQPELRRQVEDLLRLYQDAGSFLEKPAAEPPATGAFQDGAEQASSLEVPGSLIGPYKLIEPVGEGGMGSVWMAQQSEPVKRLVALKLIKAGMDTKQVIARFEAERQALALMDHPNIARVLDGGTSGGRPYFVMDLVKGVPITRYCDEHHLTPRQRLELFIPVCQAVQHAHQKGIIHRDLKPSNVLVALYDSRPVPKVIDFGVAKAAGQSLTDKTLVTGFGTIVGTLEYMSPEQAELNQLDIDTRSDIYSLGVLLYELLTGSTPFTREEMEKGGVLEMLRVIREQEPTRPSTKLSTAEGLPRLAANRGTEPARLTRLLRGELDWIVMRALEKDRNRRYESASAFAADLQRYLADDPVQACPPSLAYRLRKFTRRNKGRLAVAVGVFLAVTVMAASIGWAVRDRAARQAKAAQDEIVRLARVEDQARDSLSTARTLIAENKLPPARQKLAQARAQLASDRAALGDLAAEVEAAENELDRFQRFEDLIDRSHQAETAPVVEPTLSVGGSPGSARKEVVARMGGGRWGAKVSFLKEALGCYDILKRDDWNRALESGLLGRQQVERIRRLAYEELLWLANDVISRRQEHRSGRQLSPEAAARAALVYLLKAESAHAPTRQFYTLRARCRQDLGEKEAAQADTQRAERTPPTLALDHRMRGQAAVYAKQRAEAVRAFEAALRLEPTHYWSMMDLGSCLLDLGQDQEDFVGAARVFTGCILARPDHAGAYYARGNAYARLGRYAEALADCSRAIELNPKIAHFWNSRGSSHKGLGQPNKALADFTQAIALDPKFAHAWYNRGGAYSQLGQFDRAIADYSRAIELEPTVPLAWNNRGVTYSELGRPGKAVADFTRAIEVDPKCVDALFNRARVYSQQGQWDRALADNTRAIEVDPTFALAWLNRGITYASWGKHDEAIADYTRAIELYPTFMGGWLNRGVAYGRQGKQNRAVADFSRVIELDPKFAAGWLNRGVAYSDWGKPDRALADLTRAIELDPNHPELAGAYLARARVRSRLNQFEKARTDYETFLKRVPSHHGAHAALAWLLAACPDAKVRDPNLAVKLARKATELAPLTASYWNNLGMAHYRAGNCDDASAALTRAAELGSNDAGHWLILALVHWKRGNPDAARKLYTQSVQWLEKNKEALEKARAITSDFLRLRAEVEEVLQLKKK